MCGGALFEGLARRINQRSASPDIRSQAVTGSNLLRAGALCQATSRELTARKELHEHFSDPAVQLAGALK
jgi:hypothetical protein